MQVSNKGFTLIELLIVVAIVSVLAAIALPQYQNYLNKSKFTEVVSAIAPHKIAVEMCSMDVGIDGMSECNSGKLGIPDAFTKAKNAKGNVGSILVKEGKITAKAATKLGYKEYPDYTLTPEFTNAAMIWVAGGSCKDAGLC